jgi:hypothetical protein
MELHFAAIRAFESRRDLAFPRQPAALAKRRLDETGLLPALLSHEALRRRRPVSVAELARLRIEEAQPGIQPVPYGKFRRVNHCFHRLGLLISRFPPHQFELIRPHLGTQFDGLAGGVREFHFESGVLPGIYHHNRSLAPRPQSFTDVAGEFDNIIFFEHAISWSVCVVNDSY